MRAKIFPLLDADRTGGRKRSNRIRREGVGERVIYFSQWIRQTSRWSAADASFADRALETPLGDHGPSRHSHSRHCIPLLDACDFRALQIFRFPVIDGNVALSA